MRPIDACSLKRNLCLTKCGADEKLCVGSPDSCFQQYRMDMLTLTIDEQPTVDAVPVVRCKDCRHKVEDKIYGNVFCNRMIAAYRVKLNDFCSYGERKDNEA